MRGIGQALAVAALALAVCVGVGSAAETAPPADPSDAVTLAVPAGGRAAVRRIAVRVEVPLKEGEAGARQAAAREAIRQVAAPLLPAATVAVVSGQPRFDVGTCAQGFALQTRLVESKQQGDTWVFQAEFEVSAAGVAAVLAEAGVTRQWRVVAVILDRRGPQVVRDTVAENEMVAQLAAKGYRVLEPRPSPEPSADRLARLQGAAGAAELARKLGADIIVMGELRRADGAAANDAVRTDARATLAETAEVIAVAGGTAPTAVAARELASALCGGLATGMLLRGDPLRRFKLQVGLFRRFTDADAFEKALEKLPGVDDVQREEYTEGLAFFRLGVNAEGMRMLPRLLETDPSMVPFNLRVKSWTVTGGRADVQ